MSKIHQALEKAERERKKENQLLEELSVAPMLKGETEGAGAELQSLIVGDGAVFQKLITLSDPHSLAAEQFRKLRAKVLKLKSLDSPRAIMVTSAMNSEGKTFVAANLAANIAVDLHTQAVLVDCDMRNPSLSGWLDLSNRRGLADFLSGSEAPQGFVFK
ncbi:MAG: hypothetical protein EHM36_13080, partial [Deltaproteobacteria bacterium]